MKETIGIRLNELLSKHVDLYLAEAETEEYPYAVYTCTVTPVYTKDGIHHYSSNITITVYAKDLDVVNPISEKIITEISQNMRNRRYSSVLLSDSSDCTEGIWFRELNYTINQKY